MKATISELATVGFGAFSIEHVASLAKVNKTSVYRRWPTKADLVRAALHSINAEHIPDLDTGNVRNDLIGMAEGALQFLNSNAGKMLLKMLCAGQVDTELGAIATSLREDQTSVSQKIVRRAVERGEIAPQWKGSMLPEIIFSVLTFRIQKNERITRRFIEDVIDLVLTGAKAPMPG